MKHLVLNSTLTFGAIAASVLTAVPAIAQFVTIPVTNGSFAITNTGNGNQYSGPITLLSPAGTINVTGTPSVTFFQGNITVPANTPTPMGVVMDNLPGTVSLTDGRTATTSDILAGLETVATLSGAASWDTGTGVVPVNSTVAFTVRNGYASIPAADVSAYPTPQFNIPITNGTFSVTAPAGAAPETLTLNSVLTPLGTANITLSFPVLVNPNTNPNDAYPFTLNPGDSDIKIGAIANGTVDLSDGTGRIATISNIPVLLTGTARVVQGSTTYTLPDVYPTEISITGTFNGGVISVPESAVGLPVTTPPPSGNGSNPPPGSGVNNPGQSPISNRPEPISTPILRPEPISTPVRQDTEFQLGFASTLNLGGEPNTFANEDRNIDEEGSPLSVSRIHPGLVAR